MKKTLRTEARIARAAFAAMLLGTPGAVFAQFIAFPGGTYTQNFDGLPTNHNFAISGSVSGSDGPFRLDDLSWAGSQPYTMVGMSGWQIYETGGSQGAAFSVNSGATGTAQALSLGATNVAERALGSVAGSTRAMAVGAVFKNTSGVAISSVSLTYTGEQWRLGRSGAGADTFFFEYKVGTGADISGLFTSVAALDFITPTTSGTVGYLNGNDPANQMDISGDLSGLNWNPDEFLVLRWRDINELAGNDHAIAIDDFSLTGPPIIPEPSGLAVMGLGLAALITRRKDCKG